MKEFISKLDYNVAEFFHKVYANCGEVANVIMEGISLLGEMGILFLAIGLGMALFKRTRKTGFAILFAVAIGFVFTNLIIKPYVARKRPFENMASNYYLWWLDAGAAVESGFSFPSGHTTASMAFALAIFLTNDKKWSTYVLFLPILMASSRIYLMVHYFSDCVGGLIVGTVSGLFAWLIVKWIYSSKLKLFVWARGLELFKRGKQSKVAVNETKNEAPKTETAKVETLVKEEIEEFEYETLQQEQENKIKPTGIISGKIKPEENLDNNAENE